MAIPSGAGSFDDPPELLSKIDSEVGSEDNSDDDDGSEDSDGETEVEINYTNGQPGAAPATQHQDGTESLPRFTTTSLMEDPIGARVEHILDASTPYAGDDSAPRRDQDGGRFVCYQIAGRQWLVWDSWWVDTEGEDEHFLSLDHVLHQRFNVAGWYHKIRRKKAHPYAD
jgi:hypothetical protein